MAKIATLVDTFSGTLSLWTASQTSIVSGRARLAPTIAAGYYDPPATLVSATTYDLTESEFVFELPTPPGLATVEHWFQCYIGPDANNKVGVFLYCDATTRGVEFKRFVAGSGTNVAAVAFNTTDHKWFKISMASGVVHFWTSPDGGTWTEQGGGWTSTVDLTASSVNFAVSGERTPGNIEIDNVNNGGSGSPPPTIDPSDTFATKNTTLWTWNGTSGVASGNLELAPNTNNSSIQLSNGIVSNGTVDLADDPIYINLSGLPSSVTTPPFATFYLALSTSSTSINDALTFQVPLSTTTSEDYEAHVYLGGADTPAYLYGLYGWYQIKLDSGTIYWQGSDDGITWTTVHSVASTSAPATDALYIHMYAKGNTANTGSFKVASINVSPGSPPVSGIADTFATKDLTKWTWVGGAGVLSDNLEVIPSLTTTPTLNWIRSSSTINLSSEDFLVEVAGFPTTPPDGFISLYLMLSTSSTVQGPTPANALLFRITTNTTDHNNSQVEYFVSGVQTIPAYPYTTDRWFRIRKSGTDVLWQTSANGDTNGVWTTHATVPAASLPATTALYAHIGAYGSAANTTPYKVGSVNTPPESVSPAAPGPVQSFTATPGAELVNLSWVAPASNGGAAITGYVLQQTVPAGPAALNLGPTTYSYQATGLTPGTQYTFSVYAKNPTSGTSVTATATPTPSASGSLPSQPTSVVATAGSAAASLTWTAPSTPNGTITGYRIVDHNGTTVHTTTGTGTSANVTGLVNGVPYYFQVYASNANGEGSASVQSNTVTPFASGADDSFLSLRASFGALPGGTYQSLESSVGRVMQPLAYNYRLGDPFPSSEILSIGQRDRSPLLLLDTSGMSMASMLAGVYDNIVTTLGESIDATNRYVYVCPFFAVNDWTKPWSPFHQSSSPDYDPSRSMGTQSMEDLNIAFRHLARLLRAASPYARLVWCVSVEPQPTSAADQWGSFHPGPAADVVMLMGRNHGVGPVQGLSGLTAWLTPSQIFNNPYTALDTVSDPQTPFWLWTACHEPSTTYNPVGPGFPPGSSVPVDSANSKGDWVDLLMESTSWPRTTAVVWEDVPGTRNWPINSSTASNTAMRSHLADQDGWERTEIVHDQLGDHVRGLVSGLAKWARSGPLPAEDTNLYDRPDARDGVRASIIHSTPYSHGPKTSATVSPADMVLWNKLHGLILRQAARYGMQGWAYSSGSLRRDHSSLMHPGSTSTTDGINYVSLTTDYDALPGPVMQREGGMTDAFAGSAAPLNFDMPDFEFTTVNTTDVTITYTAPQNPPSAVTGYTFSAYDPLQPVAPPGPGQFNPEAVSGVVSPGSTYTFTNLRPDTLYTFGVAAQMGAVAGSRRRKDQRTDATVVVPPSGGGLPAKSAGIYWESYSSPTGGRNGERMNTLPTNANVFYIFQCYPTTGDQSQDGRIAWDGPPPGVTMAQMQADIAAHKAAGRRVLMTVGGAGARFNLGNRTASQQFVSDFKAISDSLGGLNGIDLNNYEQLPIINTDEWIWALQTLRSTAYFGPDFIITSPCTVSTGLPQFAIDRTHLVALHNAGVFDMVCPQFYESGDGTNTTSHIAYVFNQFKAAGMPESKLGIGFSINTSRTDCWTAANAAAAYTTTKAAFPAMHGAFNFSDEMDPTDSFATTVIPAILA